MKHRYWTALVGLLLVAVVVPAVVVGVVGLAVGFDVVPLLAAVLVPLGVAAAVCLAFVGDSIVVAEVGPLRAIALSFQVVRRNPWATLGLLLVLTVVSVSVHGLVARLAGTVPGLALAIAAYAFVATGLALARMQFFYDRLRRFRADLIPPLPSPT